MTREGPGPVTAYIGLGANLDSQAGDRAANLRAARRAMGEIGVVGPVSSVYETTAWGVPDKQPDYLNQVAGLSTSLEPPRLVAAILKIESVLGRMRPAKNAPRTIDIDVLLCGDAVVDRPGVRVPHPRMHERPFVLVPLAEIAPGAVHPELGATIAELLVRVGRAGVRRYSGCG